MEFTEQLKKFYGYDDDTFQALLKDVTMDDFPSLELFPQLLRVEHMINTIIEKQFKAIIYGDYDADGMIATSIMKQLFIDLNYSVDTYIPNRYQDGYGLTLKQAKRLVVQGYQSVICVDNGVSAHEAIEYLKDHRILVIVIDHHEVTVLPKALDAYFHPLLDTPIPLARCSGYLTYLLYVAVIKKHHPYLLALAAISTLTDAMPLKKDNRILVKLGLAMMNQYKFIQIASLVKQFPVDEQSIYMNVGPSFNALGRMLDDERLQDIVTYLLTEDTMENMQLSTWIKDVNQQRKTLSQQWIEMIPKNDDMVQVLMIDERSGLTGLIANRLLEGMTKVVAIFSPDSKNDDYLVGSIRAVEGYQLMNLIRSYPGDIIAFGGHPAAVGLTIKKDYFEQFKNYLISAAIKLEIQHHHPKLIPLKTNELTFKNLEIIQKLKPFGQDFPAPLFLITPVPVYKLQFTSKAPFYLSTRLTSWSQIFSFSITKDKLRPYSSIGLIGTIEENIYQSSRSVRFQAQQFTILN
jgi:single-stranded-DNA-specific exonuclease